MASNPIVRSWSATIWMKNMTPAEIADNILKTRAWMNMMCGKWIFQVEHGEEKKDLHIQAMFTLFKKDRGSSIKNKMEAAGMKVPGGKALSAISANGMKTAGLRYSGKLDGRVDGPWSSEDKKFDENADDINEIKAECPVKPDTMMPWQLQAHEWLMDGKYEAREIRVIVNTPGNMGKSEFLLYCRMYDEDKIMIVPNTIPVAQIPGYIVTTRKKGQRIWLLDMPRGVDGIKATEYFTMLESLKIGLVHDWRYKGKETLMLKPKMLVFMNRWPWPGALSEDRWWYWVLNPHKGLLERSVSQWKPKEKKKKAATTSIEEKEVEADSEDLAATEESDGSDARGRLQVPTDVPGVETSEGLGLGGGKPCPWDYGISAAESTAGGDEDWEGV
jgi:hypothetical protein